jgi:prophage antirepressor-like protein
MYFEILSDKERALMNMLLDGFSAEDICQILGYKDTSVLKNVKCRALRKMKSAAAQKRCSYTA